MSYINLLTGIFPTGQIPADGKAYVLTLAELMDLGANDFKAFYYYDRLEIICLQNNTKYVWREEREANEVGGLIATSFTYPANTIANEINYSGKTFNFFLTDTQTALNNLLGTRLITGTVVWLSDFNFEVTPLTFYINGVYGTSNGALITLDASDPVLKRFDVIKTDVDGNITVSKGEFSSTPSIPLVNTENELVLKVIYIEAGASEPLEGFKTLVYDENVGTPNEFDASVSLNPSHADLSSTEEPNTNANHITISSSDSFGNVAILFDAGVLLSINNYDVLHFYINTSNALTNSNGILSIKLYNANSVIGEFLLGQNTYGWNDDQLGYHSVAIPLLLFNATNNQFDSIEILSQSIDAKLLIDTINLVRGGISYRESDSFLALIDTFNSYEGRANKFLKVNSAGTGIIAEELEDFNKVIISSIDIINFTGKKGIEVQYNYIGTDYDRFTVKAERLTDVASTSVVDFIANYGDGEVFFTDTGWTAPQDIKITVVGRRQIWNGTFYEYLNVNAVSRTITYTNISKVIREGDLPTNTSDLINDGDDTVNPFIDATDLPVNTSELNNDGEGTDPFMTSYSVRNVNDVEEFKVTEKIQFEGVAFDVANKRIVHVPLVFNTVFIDTVNGNDSTGIIQSPNFTFKTDTGAFAALPADDGSTWIMQYIETGTPTRVMNVTHPNRDLEIRCLGAGTFDYSNVTGSNASAKNLKFYAPKCTFKHVSATPSTFGAGTLFEMDVAHIELGTFPYGTGSTGFFYGPENNLNSYIKTETFNLINDGVTNFGERPIAYSGKFIVTETITITGASQLMNNHATNVEIDINTMEVAKTGGYISFFAGVDGGGGVPYEGYLKIKSIKAASGYNISGVDIKMVENYNRKVVFEFDDVYIDPAFDDVWLLYGVDAQADITIRGTMQDTNKPLALTAEANSIVFKIESFNGRLGGIGSTSLFNISMFNSVVRLSGAFGDNSFADGNTWGIRSLTMYGHNTIIQDTPGALITGQSAALSFDIYGDFRKPKGSFWGTNITVNENTPVDTWDDLNENNAVTGTHDIDWNYETHYLTLTGNTTFTESNLPAIGKTKIITLYMTGSFTPTWPTNWVDNLQGSYNGSVLNQITIEYIKSGVYWMAIS